MPSISAFILGLVQGLTEFLPVSSSGHLVLVSALLGYESPGLVLETVVHVATTLAVIIYFRQRLGLLIKGAFSDLGDLRPVLVKQGFGPVINNGLSEYASLRVVLMLALAFVVTAIIGLVLSQWITAAFDSPLFAGSMLLVTAAALASTRFLKLGDGADSLLSFGWKAALIVGLAQGIAILPGISRSGFTIIAALWAGQGRSSSAEFSFLLAVPTLSAASLFSLAQESQISGIDSMEILVAGVIAFLSGLAAIHWLMRWLQRGRLWWFSGYCALAGGLSLTVWGLDLL